jgi:predicted DNA-binding transcriptional regulator YafY
MKSSRLLEMLLLLQARGQVTAGELAERLEVSPRTVYRDAEARALFVLTTGGAQEDLGLGGAARSAILKVMRAVPEPFRPAATAISQRILVDPARWMRSRDPVGQLGVLQAAVFTDRRVRLRYGSSGQRVAAERVVDPYGLVSKAGVWYLVADQDGAPRLFRVSRVASAVAAEEPVRRRDGVELAEAWEALRQQVEERPAGAAVRGGAGGADAAELRGRRGGDVTGRGAGRPGRGGGGCRSAVRLDDSIGSA